MESQELDGDYSFLVVILLVSLAIMGLLHHMIKYYRLIQFWFKSALTLGCILLVSSLGILISGLCALLGTRGNINHYVGKLFVTIMTPLVGVSFQVEGSHHLQSHRPCIFICNHQSSLDMLTM